MAPSPAGFISTDALHFQVDSYGGSLKYKVRYTLARGLSEVMEKPDVILVGNGRRLVYRRGEIGRAHV